MLSLRRITLLMLFVLPLTTLFLMMMGIALTQAAMLQKTSVPTAASSRAFAAAEVTHKPLQTEPDPLTQSAWAAGASTAALVVPAPTAWGTSVDKTLLAIATVPLLLFLVVNWVNRRRDHGRGVEEGFFGSSSASNR